MKLSESLYQNLLLIHCGMAAGGLFLTRIPASLPSEFSPFLYYGFFSMITFIPLILGIVRTWKGLAVRNRKGVFGRLFFLLCIVVLAGLLCQKVIPSYPLIQALVIIALVSVGFRVLEGRIENKA